MKGWTTARTEGAVTVSRAGRARFDLSVETQLAGNALSLGRIAHQIRQDIWRACQNVRGFSPVIRVQAVGNSYHVIAGGQVDDRRGSPHVEQTIEVVLSRPANRNRWVTHARRKMI